MKHFKNKRILLITAYLVLVFVLLSFAVLFAKGVGDGVARVTRTDLVNQIKALKFPKFYIVQSGSMEPAIKTGSVVVSYPAGSYTTGDVITFSKSPGSKKLVTHRIEARFYPDGINKDPIYKTSGDANEDFDPGNVLHSQIVGKTILTVPYLGYIANYAKQPYGFLLFVIIPATIIIYEELKTVFGETGKGLKEVFSKALKKKSVSEKDVLKERKGLPKSSVIIPVVGASLVMFSLSVAFLSDKEQSTGNLMQAAASFGEKTAPLYDSNPFTCPLGATSTSGPVYGTVILKIEGTNIAADVTLAGATPNSSYDVWINQDPGGCPLSSPSFAAAITTDSSGNGSAFDLSITLISGAANFWVSVVGGGQVLRSTAVTLP